MKLPEPSIAMQEHSSALFEAITQIIKQKGPITFAEYMQLALYMPGLGYYSAGNRKFGPGGDFITAPEMSPLFSYTLANYIAETGINYSQQNILEFGAGSGTMAAHILLRLQALNRLPEHYYILELSADLRARQKATLLSLAPTLYERVIWLDQFPAVFYGIILANEVLDAMPVHIFHYNHQYVYERYVDIDAKNGQFIWKDAEPSTPELNHYLQPYLADLPDDYISEVNLASLAWLRSLAAFLMQGEILLIDYGFTDPAFYHPQRQRGTLMCHYQHHAHDDPFFLPGLQDITSHIHFTPLMKVASDNGLTIVDYTSQANFLLQFGLLTLAESQTGIEQYKTAQALKQLLLPSEMGELFKVLRLKK